MKYSTLVDFDLQSDFAHILPDEEQNHHNPHDSHSSSNTSSHPSGMHQFTAKEIDRMNRGLPPWESMSFACGGWLQFYMFGVAKGLQACKMDKGVRYYGCSAGALTAAGLVLDGEFDEAIQFCKDYCLPKAYSDIRGLFNLADYVQKCLDLTLLAKFHQGVEPNTLFVAATKLPLGQAERFTVFRTHEDLSTALLCSSAAFPFAPLVKHKGSWYIDGGLSDFQPVEDDNTITVSPFYFSECDIKPSRYIPLWWTFLPPKNTDTVEWLYKLGFEDCINYMKQRGIPIQFHKHGEYYESIIDHPYNDQGQVR